jgi:hypothetical protein
MSTMGIFLIGLGVSTLCLFGLYFTMVEIGRLGRESDGRRRTERG